jgi:uncharacterized damage-inducible protein DinB
MEIKKLLTEELEHEAAITEKFLLRIPKDKLSWRPHEKSMTLQQLGSHLAEIPSWITGTMDYDEMVMDDYRAPQNDTVEDMVSTLKKNTEEAKNALQKENTEYVDKTWKMVMEGQTVFELPKYQTLRAMVLNQLPHHRAQLGVYLRLLGESVPSTYGPSADEQ